MTHRTDRICLAPTEARCEPRNGCTIKDSCARYLAALPPSGAKLADFSLIGCVSYLSVADAAVQKPEGRKVHPPLGGLSA